ncbi:MAG: hypothetical protein ACOCWG_06015 [bacterium]
MPWTSEHIKWLIDTGEHIKTDDGKDIKVFVLQHENDDNVLSAWAKHFRNHYCLDDLIDDLRGRKTRIDYLEKIKFPSYFQKIMYKLLS